MKAIIIKLATRNEDGGTQDVPGWLVPDTEDLFGIDMRIECDMEAIPPQPPVWVITHLPTGMAVRNGEYTRAGSNFHACGVAQRFYQQYKTHGWELNTKDPAVILEPFKKLTQAQKVYFWEKVATTPIEIEPEMTPPTSSSAPSEMP